MDKKDLKQTVTVFCPRCDKAFTSVGLGTFANLETHMEQAHPDYKEIFWDE